jgi:hypothetical protein
LGNVINEGEKGYVDPDGPTKNPKLDIHRGRQSTARDEDPEATVGGLRERLSAVGSDEDKTWRPGRARPGAGKDEGAEPDDADVPLPVGWLVVVEGPGVGNVAILETGVNILGRSAESQVPLDFGDRHISREDHVRVSYNRKTRRFRIVPGKGTETWIRGNELVDEARDLAHGDLITIGTTVLRFIPFCDERFDWLETDPA